MSTRVYIAWRYSCSNPGSYIRIHTRGTAVLSYRVHTLCTKVLNLARQATGGVLAGPAKWVSHRCRPAADPGSFGIGSERAVNPGNVGILHSEPKQPGFPTPTPTALGSATTLGRPQPDGCPMPARGRSPRLWDRLRAGSEPAWATTRQLLWDQPPLLAGPSQMGVPCRPTADPEALGSWQ
jgi:hypothetical protein